MCVLEFLSECVSVRVCVSTCVKNRNRLEGAIYSTWFEKRTELRCVVSEGIFFCCCLSYIEKDPAVEVVYNVACGKQNKNKQTTKQQHVA